jgi:hypothetical protein
MEIDTCLVFVVENNAAIILSFYFFELFVHVSESQYFLQFEL